MKRFNLGLWKFIPVLVILSGCGGGEIARHEGRAIEAEMAGNLREALACYVQAVQAFPENDLSARNLEIREKAILIYRKLDPRPALPVSAERFFVRGEALAGSAGKEVEYLDAARAYEKGLKSAPWDPRANYNAGLLQELAGFDEKALCYLKLYLCAGPEKGEASEVEKKVAELEVKVEKLHSFEGKWNLYFGPGRKTHPHCEIERTIDGWILEDLISSITYGNVSVSGRRLSASYFREGECNGITWFYKGNSEFVLSEDGLWIELTTTFADAWFDYNSNSWKPLGWKTETAKLRRATE